MQSKKTKENRNFILKLLVVQYSGDQAPSIGTNGIAQLAP